MTPTPQEIEKDIQNFIDDIYNPPSGLELGCEAFRAYVEHRFKQTITTLQYTLAEKDGELEAFRKERILIIDKLGVMASSRPLSTKIASLTHRLEQAERDTKRLDWLDASNYCIGFLVKQQVGSNLRTAIDSAIHARSIHKKPNAVRAGISEADKRR